MMSVLRLPSLSPNPEPSVSHLEVPQAPDLPQATVSQGLTLSSINGQFHVFFPPCNIKDLSESMLLPTGAILIVPR